MSFKIDVSWSIAHNIFSMETNRLKQFCLIVEVGSLTKAADLLHLTHSALSKSMKLLQEEMGLALLQPSGRGLSITDDGMIFYGKARLFLKKEEELFQLSKESSQSSLRLGAVEIFIPLICEAEKNNPFLESPLTVLDLEPGQMEQMIVQRELDFGVTYAPFPMDQLDVFKIGEFELGLYHLEGCFTKTPFDKIPFVVPSSPLSSHPLGIKERDGWPESLFPRHQLYKVNLLSTALNFILQGLSAIYIPHFLAKNGYFSNKLVPLSLPSEIQSLFNKKKRSFVRECFILKHKDRVEDKCFKKFCSIIRKSISVKSI